MNKDVVYAFPFGNYEFGGEAGMTLRDYFAAKALQGMIAYDPDRGTYQENAKSAYRWANAMLAAREAK